MAGFYGVFGEPPVTQDLDCLRRLLDVFGLCQTRAMAADGCAQLSASWLKSAPLSDDRCYESKDWLAVVDGDVVSIGGQTIRGKLPWKHIVEMLESRDYGEFTQWRGSFSICAYDRKHRKAILVSDRKAQRPVYYSTNGKCLNVGSELSLFCSASGMNIEFDREWLYDYLFFNFGMFGATFLSNVTSLAPASVLDYDLASGKMSITQYAPIFSRKRRLLSGREELEYALETFRTSMLPYFEGENHIACPLTCGWDGRMLFAFRPNDECVTSYTYGVPGCEDIVEAADTARRLKLRHKAIEFDQAFLDSLPAYAYLTVFLSSGLQSIARSTLLYAYEHLTHRGKEFPVTLSGISGDMQFRGHGFTPAITSYGIRRAFESGMEEVEAEPWNALLGTRSKDFRGHVESRMHDMVDLYGPFSSSEHHLSFMVYEVAGKYFAGERLITNHFTTWRTPYLDDDIVDLAYSIEDSTLKFSRFNSAYRGNKGEDILDSYIMSRCDPRLARIRVRGVPPVAAQKGHWATLPYKLLYRAPQKLTRKWENAPLEDWSAWMRNQLAQTVHNLVFDKKARIREFINPDALESLEPGAKMHYVTKLASVEMILHLIENGWSMPSQWPVPGGYEGLRG